MSRTKSLLMFITAMIIYGTIGIFRRYIPVSSALLACVRGIIGTLFLLVLALLQRRKINHKIGMRTVLKLALTGAIMGLNWILLFEAYNYTTVATATLCYYMQPTIVVLSAPIFFKEKLTMRKGICALISIVGMVMVSGIRLDEMPELADLKGILFGLGAAVLYATVVIRNKKLPGVDTYQKTMIQLASAAIVLLPYLVVTEDAAKLTLGTTGLIMLLIVGFLHTGVAYALYFGSMEGLKAQSIALLSYLDPVTALFLSALILRENLSVLSILGAVLILGAAVISEIHQKEG